MENKWSTKPGQEWIKCPHCEITFRIRKPSQEGQAGVSAEQVLDMVLKLSEDIDQELWGADGSKEINARGRIVPLISAFADALLATAPREQATSANNEDIDAIVEWLITSHGLKESSREIARNNLRAHETILRREVLQYSARIAEECTLDETRDEKFRIVQTLRTAGNQPQPAIAMALSAANVEKFAAELHEVYWQESIRQRDTTGLIPRHRRDYNELSEDIKDYDRALARFVLQRLAAHDQKVRAEVLEEAADCCDGAQRDKWQGEKAGFTSEQTRLWNKWATELGDAIRSLAGAEEKK